MSEKRFSEAIEYAYQFDPSMHIPRNWAGQAKNLEAKLEALKDPQNWTDEQLNAAFDERLRRHRMKGFEPLPDDRPVAAQQEER